MNQKIFSRTALSFSIFTKRHTQLWRECMLTAPRHRIRVGSEKIIGMDKVQRFSEEQ